jgi:hypothetical protein
MSSCIHTLPMLTVFGEWTGKGYRRVLSMVLSLVMPAGLWARIFQCGHGFVRLFAAAPLIWRNKVFASTDMLLNACMPGGFILTHPLLPSRLD